jgi:hypothetical protein
VRCALRLISVTGTSLAYRERAPGSVMSHRADTSSVVAETVRAACLNVARLAYEDAGIRGLCAEGRWEAALTAIRRLDLSVVLDLGAGPPVSTVTLDR